MNPKLSVALNAFEYEHKVEEIILLGKDGAIKRIILEVEENE